MTGRTHLSCGIATSLFLCGDVVSGILLSVGSLLPDIDHKNSLFGKALPFIPKIIKHRTWTHSLLFLILCYFINVYLCIGCFVHLFLDMMTKQGCPLFYPFDIKIKLPFASQIYNNVSSCESRPRFKNKSRISTSNKSVNIEIYGVI